MRQKLRQGGSVVESRTRVQSPLWPRAFCHHGGDSTPVTSSQGNCAQSSTSFQCLGVLYNSIRSTRSAKTDRPTCQPDALRVSARDRQQDQLLHSRRQPGRGQRSPLRHSRPIWHVRGVLVGASQFRGQNSRDKVDTGGRMDRPRHERL